MVPPAAPLGTSEWPQHMLPVKVVGRIVFVSLSIRTVGSAACGSNHGKGRNKNQHPTRSKTWECMDAPHRTQVLANGSLLGCDENFNLYFLSDFSMNETKYISKDYFICIYIYVLH